VEPDLRGPDPPSFPHVLQLVLSFIASPSLPSLSQILALTRLESQDMHADTDTEPRSRRSGPDRRCRRPNHRSDVIDDEIESASGDDDGCNLSTAFANLSTKENCTVQTRHICWSHSIDQPAVYAQRLPAGLVRWGHRCNNRISSHLPLWMITCSGFFVA
jgi:hypothetical protein